MRPLIASILLALGLHMALLFGLRAFHRGGDGEASRHALQTRMLAEEPAAGSRPDLSTASDTAAALEQPGQSTVPTPSSTPAPVEGLSASLDAQDVSIPLPDAVLPEGGAEISAYVDFNADGSVDSVEVATGDLPQAFGDVALVGLRRLRLGGSTASAGSRLRGLCLSLRFESGQAEARLAQRRDGDKARCLAPPAAARRGP